MKAASFSKVLFYCYIFKSSNGDGLRLLRFARKDGGFVRLCEAEGLGLWKGCRGNLLTML